MSNNKLDISELDYNTLKSNLRSFLEDNPVFNDYNFAGSALDVLNSVLAFNAHHLSFYTHMLFNEAFLDTAVKRESVVSHAKQLNYTPKSISASFAIVDINITPNTTPIDILIPKYTSFNSVIDGKTYEFITIEDSIALPTGVNNVYKAEDVKLVQGYKSNYAFVKNTNNLSQRFVLPFSDIDTKYLTVTIQKEESDTTNEIWQYSPDIVDINSDSKVYFLQEVENGQFELTFGDGIIGKALEHGNVIIVDFIRTAGKLANGANSFTINGSISGTNNINVDIKQVATGGSDADSTNFIRKIAPRAYESQKRAVTYRDYETYLLKDQIISENFDSIQIWGGEDNEPKLYGNVIVSVKPKTGVVVSSFLKDKIKSLLDDVNVVGVIPIIIDPKYLYLELNVDVTYASNKTTKTRDEIVKDVENLIKDYRDNELSFFDKTFRYSELSCLINDSDSSHISNLIDIRMKRYETLLFNQIQTYDIDFRNAIEEGTIKSSYFFITEFQQSIDDKHFFEDDRQGNIVLKKIAVDNTISIVNDKFGLVNYETGNINLPNFVPVNLIDSNEFSISAKPKIDDIYTVRNLIITFKDEDIKVTAKGINN